MHTETNGKNGQHNSYTFYEGGKHTHTWYNPKTGQMGYNGENCSKDIKKIMGETGNASTDGRRLKGIRGE